MDIQRILAAALVASAVSVASANENTSLLPHCVDLGPDRDIVRNGSTSSFTLRDGDTHYLVALRVTCNSMRPARSVSVRADGVDGRLCPSGTRVQTRHDI
jgi:hypothetical protein